MEDKKVGVRRFIVNKEKIRINFRFKIRLLS